MKRKNKNMNQHNRVCHTIQWTWSGWVSSRDDLGFERQDMKNDAQAILSLMFPEHAGCSWGCHVTQPGNVIELDINTRIPLPLDATTPPCDECEYVWGVTWDAARALYKLQPKLK